MISYLAEAARCVLQCNPDPRPPHPLALNLYPDGVGLVPSLESFIEHLIKTSRVDEPTLISTLIYLKCIKSRLYPSTQGFQCTAHRVFLASIILADKYANDESMWNQDWAQSSLIYFEGKVIFGFSPAEVNLLESLLLHLLDWDLGITERDWNSELSVFRHVSVNSSAGKALRIRKTAELL